MQLLGDFSAGTSEQDPGAFGQDAAEAAPAAVDLPSPTALAAGVVQPRGSGAWAADRSSLLIAADQRPHHAAADASCGMTADVLVAADADRPPRAILPGPGGRVRTGSMAGAG